jgi:hypothetical protein
MAATGLADDLSSGPTVLRTQSASEGIAVAKPDAGEQEKEKGQEKKEEKEEDIPSYSKFKFAFERMLVRFLPTLRCYTLSLTLSLGIGRD